MKESIKSINSNPNHNWNKPIPFQFQFKYSSNWTVQLQWKKKQTKEEIHSKTEKITRSSMTCTIYSIVHCIQCIHSAYLVWSLKKKPISFKRIWCLSHLNWWFALKTKKNHAENRFLRIFPIVTQKITH